MKTIKIVIFSALFFCFNIHFENAFPGVLPQNEFRQVADSVFEILAQFYRCLEFSKPSFQDRSADFDEAATECYLAIDIVGEALREKEFRACDFMEALEALQVIGFRCKKMRLEMRLKMAIFYRKLNICICKALVKKLVRQESLTDFSTGNSFQLSRDLSNFFWNFHSLEVPKRFFKTLFKEFGAKTVNCNVLTFIISYMQQNFREGFHTAEQTAFAKTITDEQLSTMIRKIFLDQIRPENIIIT